MSNSNKEAGNNSAQNSCGLCSICLKWQKWKICCDILRIEIVKGINTRLNRHSSVTYHRTVVLRAMKGHRVCSLLGFPASQKFEGHIEASHCHIDLDVDSQKTLLLIFLHHKKDVLGRSKSGKFVKENSQLRAIYL